MTFLINIIKDYNVNYTTFNINELIYKIYLKILNLLIKNDSK